MEFRWQQLELPVAARLPGQRRGEAPTSPRDKFYTCGHVGHVKFVAAARAWYAQSPHARPHPFSWCRFANRSAARAWCERLYVEAKAAEAERRLGAGAG